MWTGLTNSRTHRLIPEMKIASILADMERTVNIQPCCCLSLVSQPHSVLQCRSLSVQRFSTFLQHLVARAKTVPSNQIAEGFEFCWLTRLTLLQPEVARTWKSAGYWKWLVPQNGVGLACKTTAVCSWESMNCGRTFCQSSIDTLKKCHCCHKCCECTECTSRTRGYVPQSRYMHTAPRRITALLI